MIPARLQERLAEEQQERERKGLLRFLSVWDDDPSWINLADNDYLDLSRDPGVVAAAREAASRYGCSASASPLISGYQTPHRELEKKLCAWHGFSIGLVWNSGYAANQAVLSRLPRKGDIVFADRLIHNSMVTGILHSGARLIRYQHNDTDHLQTLLQRHAPPTPMPDREGEPDDACSRRREEAERIFFVVTESVFSMDGDAPDLAAIAELKKTFPFCLIVDEAHATGWFGSEGAGLAVETGSVGAIDILVGTLGKALGSQGAYTLFHDPVLRESLVNQAGEFIYSTYLSPIAAAAASAAVNRVRELSSEQNQWRETSRQFRASLRAEGWSVPEGDSPIVPVVVGDTTRTLSLAAFLRHQKILVGAVRPPTVPSGASRLRLSLKRGFTPETGRHIANLLNQWRTRKI